VVQPLPFNHKIHVQNDVPCDTCHETVFKAAFAGLPRVAICMDCHEDGSVLNEQAKPAMELLHRHAEAKTELEWVQLYELPHHVYYSHRRHAGIAKLPCATCHGEIGQSETPPAYPVAETLNMSTCMDCHAKSGVDNDCAWCHR
jgi:DnaJ-class molecular chaperone